MLTRALQTFALAAVMMFVFTVAVFAQDTSVHVPFGNWIVELLPFVALAAGILLCWLLWLGIQHLPPAVRAFITPAVQAKLDQLVYTGIEWGVQAVSGAVKNQEISIPVGNAVVAHAAQNVIDNADKAVIAAAGGADGIKKQIIAALEGQGVILPPESKASDILASQPVKAVTANP